MSLKILLAGDGGQGIQLMSDLICESVFLNGKNVTFIPNYGLEQRGGVSLAFIQISDGEINYPKFTQADILIIMSNQAELRTKRYADVAREVWRADEPAKILRDNNIPLQSLNLFFLGKLVNFLAKKNILEPTEIFKMIEKKLSNKVNWQDNKKAWELGD